MNIKTLRESLLNHLNELKQANPEGIKMDRGFFSAQKALDKLYSIISNSTRNKDLYNKLDEVLQKTRDGGDPSVPYGNLSIELVKGVSIPLRLYLIHKDSKGKTSSLGKFRGRKTSRWTFGKANICLGLYGDPDLRYVQWSDDYEQTLDHEVTHAYQTLSVALRSIRIKNKDPKFIPQAKELSKRLDRAAARGGTSAILKGDNRDPIEYMDKRIAYYRSAPELGANANALIKQLVKYYGLDSVELVGKYLALNKPTFEEINNDLVRNPNFRSSIWMSLVALSQHEQAIKGIRREEDTEGWKIRQELLKVVYDIYRRHYKR